MFMFCHAVAPALFVRFKGTFHEEEICSKQRIPLVSQNGGPLAKEKAKTAFQQRWLSTPNNLFEQKSHCQSVAIFTARRLTLRILRYNNNLLS